jgi:accessory gene regulator B
MLTIHGLAEKLGGYIARELEIKRQKENMLIFGLELLLGSIIEFIIVMFLAYFLGILQETLILVLTAGILRLASGGEHCRAYCRCLISGTIFFLLMGCFVKWLSSLITYQGIALLTVASAFIVFAVIWKYAPGETENKPLSEADRVKGKRFSYLVAVFFFGLVILLLFLKVKQAYILPIIIGMLCQVFTLTPAGYKFILYIDKKLSFFFNSGR